MPSGVVPHCRSSGLVHHYMPCLFAWYLTIGHACWSVLQREEGWCYSYRGFITSDMFADPEPLSEMPACTVQLYQTCMLSFIYSDTHVCKVLLNQVLQIHKVCLQARCGSHGFVKLISYHPGRHIEYIKF